LRGGHDQQISAKRLQNLKHSIAIGKEIGHGMKESSSVRLGGINKKGGGLTIPLDEKFGCPNEDAGFLCGRKEGPGDVSKKTHKGCLPRGILGEKVWGGWDLS